MRWLAGCPAKTSLGAPGKRRPAIVALSQPKAPRLHQSNRSPKPASAAKPTSGWERAEGRLQAERPARGVTCAGRDPRVRSHEEAGLHCDVRLGRLRKDRTLRRGRQRVVSISRSLRSQPRRLGLGLAGPARPGPRQPPLYHRPSSRPASTGHFCLAANRTFLLGVDTVW